MANQLRNWVLTINNPSDDEEKTFEYIKGGRISRFGRVVVALQGVSYDNKNN